MTTLIVIVMGIFVVGAVAGVIAIVSIGIRKEERHLSLTRQAPGPVSQGARMLTGLHVRRRSDHLAPALPSGDTLV